MSCVPEGRKPFKESEPKEACAFQRVGREPLVQVVSIKAREHSRQFGRPQHNELRHALCINANAELYYRTSTTTSFNLVGLFFIPSTEYYLRTSSKLYSYGTCTLQNSTRTYLLLEWVDLRGRGGCNLSRMAHPNEVAGRGPEREHLVELEVLHSVHTYEYSIITVLYSIGTVLYCRRECA